MNEYIHTTFCDDIRQEASGKISLIGTYNSHMYVPEYPHRRPKLCVDIILCLERRSELTSATSTLWDSDKVLSKICVDVNPDLTYSEDDPYHVIRTSVECMFHEMVENTRLRITAEIDDALFEGVPLVIEQKTAES